MPKKSLKLTPELLERYVIFLREQERSAATIEKYVHDLTALAVFLAGRPISKGALLEWKETLIENYAPASVNTKLAAVNSFLTFCGLNGPAIEEVKNTKGPLSLRG